MRIGGNMLPSPPIQEYFPSGPEIRPWVRYWARYIGELFTSRKERVILGGLILLNF
jgi:hypothetical protein